MMRTIGMADFVRARKRRLAAEEWEALQGSDGRRLLRLAVGLAVFFGAWLGRGLGVW